MKKKKTLFSPALSTLTRWQPGPGTRPHWPRFTRLFPAHPLVVLVDHQEHSNTHAGGDGGLVNLQRGRQDQWWALRCHKGHRRTCLIHVKTMVLLVETLTYCSTRGYDYGDLAALRWGGRSRQRGHRRLGGHQHTHDAHANTSKGSVGHAQVSSAFARDHGGSLKQSTAVRRCSGH
jgi:hypothetical protein